MEAAGKKLERFIRSVRPYLRPSYRRAFSALKARGMAQRLPGEPVVCFDLADQAIDAVGGRYYFGLVLDFIHAGYFPVFIPHRVTLSSFGTSPIKSLLLPRRLGVIDSPHAIAEPFLLITDTTAPVPAQARVIRMDYTWRLPASAAEMPLPMFLHPRIGAMERTPVDYAPREERPVRLFFGGNTSPGKYDKDVIGAKYGMLTRRQMLAAADAAIGKDRTYFPAEGEAWLASRDPHEFVLCETQHCKIPQPRWLEAMGKADFFLACPGVGMPLCHNLIESLAAGTVPILQYQDYLSPPLEDGVDCLAFRDAESLEKVLDRVMRMGQSEVAALREGAGSYFRAHHAPGAFARKLLASPAERLLINSYRVPR